MMLGSIDISIVGRGTLEGLETWLYATSLVFPFLQMQRLWYFHLWSGRSFIRASPPPPSGLWTFSCTPQPW
ncbi:unnamed protein product [Lactuca virosa]|uniref:Uncharacterized protein n=1 Tax=Lactuca virosa TaxID=75947 RepID=A0AAU9N540_9ASTR|nr:unnamed protein product [Lactuca virosa]